MTQYEPGAIMWTKNGNFKSSFSLAQKMGEILWFWFWLGVSSCLSFRLLESKSCNSHSVTPNLKQIFIVTCEPIRRVISANHYLTFN